MKVPQELIKLGFNKRPFTFEDFEQLCHDLGVWFYQKKLRYDQGIHYEHPDQNGFVHPVIVINKKLSDFMKLWVAWHEMTHVLLHPPELQYFARGTTDKADYEANVIASIALIPTHWLKTKTTNELKEFYGCDDEFLTMRREFYRMLGV